MAGCMGSGKSYWLENYAINHIKDIDDYYITDPDSVKKTIT